ncbi:MAG: O-antigen ligase family protein [Desulfuromusa sp.]
MLVSPIESDSFKQELYISSLFAMMLFFLHLGRGLFYIHFALITFLFLIFCARKSFLTRKYSPFIISVFIYFLLTLIINIIPTDFSFLNDIPKNIVVALMTLMSCYFCEYLFFNSENSKKNKEYALKYFFYSTSILSIIIILSYVTDINLIQSTAHFKVIKFNHSMYHSAQNFLALGFCFLLYFYFNNKSRLNAILVLLFLIATLASHGRTAIITTAVSGVVYLSIATAGKRSLGVGLIIVILSLAALVAVTYISSGDPIAFSKIHTSKRIDGGSKYIKYVLDHSPYWGLGVDGAKFLREKKVIAYGSPHNIFLEAFVSMGFFGLSVFIGFILFLSYRIRLLYLLNPDPHQKALLVSVLVAFLVDGQSFLSVWAKPNMTLIFFYLFFAICIARVPAVSTSCERSSAQQ